MLDRKTKNIDAAVELLEDRNKIDKFLVVYNLIIFGITGISGAIAFAFGYISLSIVGFVIAIICLTSINLNIQTIQHRNLIIYLKRITKKKVNK